MPRKPMRPVHRPHLAPEALETRLLLATTLYRNPLAMNLHDDFNPPTPALLYPSAINVEEVEGGTITELRVSLYGVYHDRPQDMDVLVVSPTGKSVVLMSDAGGSLAIPGEDYVDLTFTDDATRNLPESTRIDGGLYRPTNYDQDDFFIENELIDAPTHTTLAPLAADNPTGMWRLYLVDDAIGYAGGIAFGWGLTFVTDGPGPAAPSTPNLHPGTDRGASNTDNITNSDPPIFRGTAPAGTEVRLFVDGVPLVTVPVTNGNYQVEAVGLREGTHAISARALDANGTEGPVSGDLIVTLDLVLPDHPSTPDLTPESDTGASNTDDDTTDTTPTFTGTATGGASTVLLFANDLPVGSAPVTNGVYTVTPTNPLTPGTYEFSVLATDLAGNSTSPTIPGLMVVIRPGGTLAPVITDVYARGSTWLAPDGSATNLTFMEYLEAQGLGDDTWGYRLTPNASLPWINVNQLVLRYDSAVATPPAAAEILVHGLRSEYAVNLSMIDDRTVLLGLSRALGSLPGGGENGDRIRLTVPDAAPDSGPYILNFNVLQGDVDRSGTVIANDFSDVKKKFFRNTNAPGPAGDTQYTPFHDVDANGSILANDFSEVKRRFFHNLPPAPAAAVSTFGATPIADDVLA